MILLKDIRKIIINKYGRFDLVNISAYKYSDHIAERITYYSKDYGIVPFDLEFGDDKHSRAHDLIFYMLTIDDEKSDYLWKKYLILITPFHFCDDKPFYKQTYSSAMNNIDISDPIDRCPLCGKDFKDVEIYPVYEYLYKWVNIKRSFRRRKLNAEEHTQVFNERHASELCFHHVFNYIINRRMYDKNLSFKIDEFNLNINDSIRLFKNLTYMIIMGYYNQRMINVEYINMLNSFYPGMLTPLKDHPKAAYFDNNNHIHFSDDESTLFDMQEKDKLEIEEMFKSNKRSFRMVSVYVGKFVKDNKIIRYDIFEAMEIIDTELISNSENYAIVFNTIFNSIVDEKLLIPYNPFDIPLSEVPPITKDKIKSISSIENILNKLIRNNFLINKFEDINSSRGVYAWWIKIFGDRPLLVNELYIQDNYFKTDKIRFAYHFKTLYSTTLVYQIPIRDIYDSYYNYEEFCKHIIEKTLDDTCINCGSSIPLKYGVCQSRGCRFDGVHVREKYIKIYYNYIIEKNGITEEDNIIYIRLSNTW